MDTWTEGINIVNTPINTYNTVMRFGDSAYKGGIEFVVDNEALSRICMSQFGIN